MQVQFMINHKNAYFIDVEKKKREFVQDTRDQKTKQFVQLEIK